MQMVARKEEGFTRSVRALSCGVGKCCVVQTTEMSQGIQSRLMGWRDYVDWRGF